MRTVLLAGLICLLAGTAHARVIHVDIDATGAKDGSSWTDAYVDLQDALGIAVSGDEIWVAEGTYTFGDRDPRSSSFVIPDGVIVSGGFTGTEAARDQRDWREHATELSGSGASGYQQNFVVRTITVSPATVIEGFTIRDARHGMLIDGGAPLIRNCRFYNNRGGGEPYLGGGAVALLAGCSPLFEDVEFFENAVFAYSASGGAVRDFTGDCFPRFVRVSFERNSASTYGGAFYGSGEFIDVEFRGNQAVFGGAVAGSSTFVRCTFAYNRCDGPNWMRLFAGGAVYGGGEFHDVRFESNWARDEGGAVWTDRPVSLDGAHFEANWARRGGAVYSAASGLEFANALFTNNHGELATGAIHINAPVAAPVSRLVNCTLSLNEVGVIDFTRRQASGLYSNGAPVELVNVISWIPEAWYDELPHFVVRRGILAVRNSLIDGCGDSGTGWNSACGIDLGGNIDDDPMFADVAGGDFRLTFASPATNAGDITALPEGLLTDLDGDPRVYGGSVDMGCYEYQAPSNREIYAARFTPKTLNPQNNGQSVQVDIEPRWTFEIGDIDTPSLVLNDSIAPVSAKARHQVLGLDFDRREVASSLEAGRKVAITVSGLLLDGTPFSAADTIAVLGAPGDGSDAPALSSEKPLVSELVVTPRAYLRAAPNPFNPTTTISFGVVQDGDVELVIYDLAGRSVKTLVSARLAAGDHEATWNGRDDAGNQVSSGVYLYQLRTMHHVETKRMVLVK